MDMDGDGLAPVEDFFVGDQAAGDDYNEGPDDFGGEDRGSAGLDGEPGNAPLVPFDPRKGPNERDLILAMTDADQEGGGMMMDYFDQSFKKNWAGPEHWKLRKVVRRRRSFQILKS